MDALLAALTRLPSAAAIGAGLVLLLVACLAALGAGRRRAAGQLEALERRVRDDGEALRRALTELDQGLRREVADSASRGFAVAFDKVREGAREQGVVLQRFNAATQTSLTELRTEIPTGCAPVSTNSPSRTAPSRSSFAPVSTGSSKRSVGATRPSSTRCAPPSTSSCKRLGEARRRELQAGRGAVRPSAAGDRPGANRRRPGRRSQAALLECEGARRVGRGAA